MADNTPSAVPGYITSLLRTGGALVGGYLIGKGYFTAEMAAQVGGALMALTVAGWSLYSKYASHKALAAAIAAPAGRAA